MSRNFGTVITQISFDDARASVLHVTSRSKRPKMSERDGEKERNGTDKQTQIVLSLWWGAIFVSGISSRMHLNCAAIRQSHERTPSLRIAGSFSSSFIQDRSRDTEGRRCLSFWRNTRFSPRVLCSSVEFSSAFPSAIFAELPETLPTIVSRSTDKSFRVIHSCSCGSRYPKTTKRKSGKLIKNSYNLDQRISCRIESLRKFEKVQTPRDIEKCVVCKRGWLNTEWAWPPLRVAATWLKYSSVNIN